MVTTWTQGRLDKSTSLLLEREYLSALRELLVVFDVYPDQPEALRLAASVVRLGHRRTSDASPAETLEPEHLLDSRLDPIFCSCDAPNCRMSWVSAYFEARSFESGLIANPLGARCASCDVTLCRNHLPCTTGPLACARCGAPLDAAPAPNGRPRTGRTPRLNKRLVHVLVLVESRRAPSGDFMTRLLTQVSPEVFEDRPRVSGFNQRRFTCDGLDLGLVFALRADEAYGTDAYDVHVHPGEETGRRGVRWVVVKIFENRPKHIDPDDPRDA